MYQVKLSTCNNLTDQKVVDFNAQPEDNRGIPSKEGNEMTEFESKCYGMSAADIREQYMQSLTARFSGLEMVVMGLLSDCQEMNEMNGYKEVVRKNLNIAKFILSEMMEAKASA